MKARTKKLQLVLAAVALSLLALVAIVVSEFYNAPHTTVQKGVSVAGIDLGGCTAEEAVEALAPLAPLAQAELTFALPDFACSVNASELSLTVDLTATAEAALQAKNKKLLFFTGDGVTVPLKVAFSAAALDRVLTERLSGVEQLPTQETVELETDAIRVTNGSPGFCVDRAVAAQTLQSALEQGKTAISLTLETIAPTALTTDYFLATYHRDPQDATFTADGDVITIIADVPGIMLSRSDVEQALSDHPNSGETYTIPAVITPAALSEKQLRTQLFADTLGEYSTKYATGNNRAKNVALAAQKINGKTLAPGETFSYLNALGPINTSSGFAMATGYSGNRVVDSVGGGVCQVSSTLYSAVLYANLEIVTRRNHSLPVSYIPAGMDATVSEGSQDFKFKNDTAYPIRIQAAASGGVLHVAICGTQDFPGRSVKITSDILKTIDPTVQEVDDPNLERGQTIVEQNGAKGLVAENYRIVYDGDAEVSRTYLGKSTYNAMAKIVRIGSGAVAAVTEAVATAPEATESATDAPPDNETIKQPVSATTE